MGKEIIGVLMITFFAGILLTFLGSMIKYNKIIDLILSFDENKHDKNKIIKVFGNNILLMGISIISIGLLGLLIFNNFINYIMFLQMSILFGGVLLTIYQINTYCKKIKV